MYRNLLYSFLALPVISVAGTTVYTDSAHPPVNLPPEVQVVLLDGPQQLQDAFFGPLPADPEAAEAVVREHMQSPEWSSAQADLAERYRLVTHAWLLGLEKYPAVVFDDREVVYGTTDVAQAERLRSQGGQP
ncbi:TIGR03757 family integrating conjugative element protein [Salmonella enterica subsp. enterica]|uniref:TIGR03757 family integrating conjugative element protein n=1 Tax=Salmonella enteritidis TaxID=149539 RepID=A0A725T6A3_SALEN|nr:TIGR03757 family integrating conjugative element protein [Salmonella enterica subsp. enterica]EDF1298589.1 TIGR03757 family integrating conjugative element protein [Salmonella enterica subsp. enterica serovar Enteritidis]EHP1066180.1 TIGR03757 family integrating conjugative element protein [Escherichia coli]EJV6192484.1 TIGR03757 family integrating conjugative element protein [Salmonella enterica]EDR7628042.1 TIGR03757 family integrating conjugative element protein [Salmonella enterica subsp